MGKWSNQKRRQRIQIPVDQDVYDAISDFAKITGRTRSNICEEIVTEAIPALYTMTKAMEQFDMDKNASFKQMADLMYRAAEEAKQMGLELDLVSDK